MSQNIDVDIDELEKFIEVLNRFQDQATDKLRGVQSAWSRCDETWKGEAKEAFNKGFEETESAVRQALEAGDDAARWLQKFHEIVQEMSHYR